MRLLPASFLFFCLILNFVERGEASSTPGGVDLSIIDSATPACQDFYQHACGKWLETAQIPADLPGIDRGFISLAEKNKVVLNEMLKKFASGKGAHSAEEKKLGRFYSACMNEEAIEKNSVSQLKDELKEIEKLTSLQGKPFASLLARFHLMGMNMFFDLSDEQDQKDSTLVIGAVDQGGLGLPDRDYYLKDDPKSKEVRELYKKFIVQTFRLLGVSAEDSEKNAATLFKIETELAKASMPRVDRRDPEKVYHRLERKGLKEKVPHFDWDTYLKESGVPELQNINVTVPDFFVALDSLFSTLSLNEVKTYLTWHFVRGVSPMLSQAFVNEQFQFESKAITGQKELPARWKRCVKMIDRQMGFALGRSFVEKTYGAQGKALTQEMVQAIETTFEKKLKELTWMDEPTRKEALKKLHAINNKMGYPNRWKDYGPLVVDSQSYLKSVLNSNIFQSHYHLNKIGKPVDREEWEMSPPTVNAYYHPSMNEMVFPAGILQLPYFDRKAPASQNYGGIGMVMGHELTHGFDDQGRQYNSDGNLINWWSPKVSKDFDERAQCIVKQYDQYEVLPGVFLNGKLTLGENIADQGGLNVAYEAWKARSGKITQAEQQKFFLAFAQSWCSKKHDTYARVLVKTDFHSPAKFRVNGVVSQFPAFAEAFGCQPGSKMAPKDRCSVW